MIDIKMIRENPELVKDNIEKKFQNEKLKLVYEIIKKDKEWRTFKAETDSLRAERNKISKDISEVKKAGKDTKVLLKKAGLIPEKIEKVEKEALKLEENIYESLLKIPNIMHPSVPIGKNEKENKEIEKIGKPIKKTFEIKNHAEIIELLKVGDFNSSAKTSGNGFYYLKGDLALLNQALIRFAIDLMSKKGYEYIEPPLMLNEKSIYASMNKEAIVQSVYDIKDEDLHLIGTAEQSLLAMHSGKTFQENELPKK